MRFNLSLLVFCISMFSLNSGAKSFWIDSLNKAVPTNKRCYFVKQNLARKLPIGKLRKSCQLVKVDVPVSSRPKYKIHRYSAYNSKFSEYVGENCLQRDAEFNHSKTLVYYTVLDASGTNLLTPRKMKVNMGDGSFLSKEDYQGVASVEAAIQLLDKICG